MILDIEDTSGSFAQDFPAMLDVSLTSADAVLLVFDVTKEESFEEVSRLRDLISSMDHSSTIPVVVVANKTDLEWSLPADGVEATVLLDWECGYVECSAKDRSSMDMVAREMLYMGRREGKMDIHCDGRYSSNCIVRRKAFPEVPALQKNQKRQKKLQGKKLQRWKRNSCNIS